MLPTIIAIAFRAKTLAGQAFTWATASAGRLLAVALALALAWGWLGWHGKAKLAKVLAATEQGYRSAQAEAARALKARDDAIAATSASIAKDNANAHSQAIAGARDAVAAYAAGHRVQSCAARGPGGSPAPALPASARVDAGAGAASGMASIAIAELDQLAANTVRAESCRALGQAWVDVGLAERGN